MPKRLTIKNPQQEKRLYLRRLIVASLAIFVLTIILLTRLIYLQLIKNDQYVTLSQQNQLELLPIEPNRGLIYDRNGTLVAENIPVFSLDIIPDHAKNIPETIKKLRKIINIDPNDIQQFYKLLKQHRKFEPVPLKIKLSEQEVAKFYIDQYRFPGVIVNARMIRKYPLGEDLASVVGYVGRIDPIDLQNVDSANYSASNFIGKTGIEKYYENLLHGQVGYQQVEVDAGGHIVRTVNKIPPTPGNNLHLTIDSKLQAVANKALGKERGAVVAIQPKTGEILALVSNPSFDPNLFVKGISSKDYSKLQGSPDKPLYNRTIRGQYPLASTIKPFIALQGLDSNTVTPDYTIWDPGWFQLPNSQHVYRDWKRGGHGYTNITKAIIVSCDTYFYNLAIALGIQKIDDILERFGFGSKTGVDMPNELSGLVPTPAWKARYQGNSWFKGDTVISGIGQGYMLTTPIQLAVATATLANRGTRYKPFIVKTTATPGGQVAHTKPLQLDPVMLQHKKNWNIIINAMQGVVKSTDPWGTGRLSFGNNHAYSVAAKTGTAQVRGQTERDENEVGQSNIPKRLRDNSLFIAFAPVHHPKIAIAVVVEHSHIAGIVARKVLDYYLLTEKKHHAATGPHKIVATS
ncbi:MAG: penicillin-binding protein 2 [Gammaproteobacteria bacterium]|nr:penicillin-binding protein 2 [Gammaproteobacteria bacterium]